ncbi:HD domain-containing protein [Sinanaerobacter chloroacetimidivorans]|uniref:HD domain-containing protein n=1 Tax=Sinanaerobacter chloroacetimidivorans TaxID=2818044 RepID=A0A8J7W0P7_9FIRM|nr:HD domain-containing protein [Sinanaerobacter chloroacetimidivorans]MBR0598649.1 HD domain-containing protein [Sinanaerobacter chloroacetimidivorans]
MQRIDSILNDTEYLDYLNKIQEAEADRIYCRHDMTHFLDVSRIAYILSLEEKLHIDKEILYAMGLLHDIGRWMEYENGIDHAIASRELAAGILQKCDFTEIEIKEVLTAIEEHRKKSGTTLLADILYRADKLSRNCILCKAKKTCRKFYGEAFLLY